MSTVKNHQGFGIVEVLVALGLVVVVVAVIGQVLVAIQRVHYASKTKTEAFVHAQAPLEILNGFKNDFFGCSCGATCSSCTRASDGQTCTVEMPYTSCWTQYPKDLVGTNEFYLEYNGSSWQLEALSSGGREAVPDNPYYKRVLTIENVTRDADDNIATTGTEDSGTKKATVTVYWTDRGIERSVQLSTIFTAWENL